MLFKYKYLRYVYYYMNYVNTCIAKYVESQKL